MVLLVSERLGNVYITMFNPFPRTITPVWSVLAGPWSVWSHQFD